MFNHSFPKVWALTSRRSGGKEGDLFLVSGSAAGQLTTWCDVTESAILKEQHAAARVVVDQQKLANLLASHQYGKALRLALREGESHAYFFHTLLCPLFYGLAATIAGILERTGIRICPLSLN
jgi:hypothetical protein